MSRESSNFKDFGKDYINNLQNSFTDTIFKSIEMLAYELLKTWSEQKQVFICGNGGSAANALHIANDFHYGVGACGKSPKIPGLRVQALSANTGILTCLANDTGYENIYSHQLEVNADSGDLLIVLSGSGNSPNVINALIKAQTIGVRSYAILAFDGGQCKNIADQVIHFPINDMQIAEDTQLIIGHLCMQWLNSHKPNLAKPNFNA